MGSSRSTRLPTRPTQLGLGLGLVKSRAESTSREPARPTCLSITQTLNLFHLSASLIFYPLIRPPSIIPKLFLWLGLSRSLMSIARAFAFPSSLPLVALFFQWLRIEVGPMAVAWVKIGMGTHETGKIIDLRLLLLIFNSFSTSGETDYCCFVFWSLALSFIRTRGPCNLVLLGSGSL